MTSINTNYSFNNRINLNVHNNNNNTSRPSFGAQQQSSQGISPEAAAAMKAQKIGQPSIPHIEEKDINFAVTLQGWTQVKQNTREVDDFRGKLSIILGNDNWSRNFNKPYFLRNSNGDEKDKGPTTAIVFPLKPGSYGYRGGDNMTMLLNGTIPLNIIHELLDVMENAGIINSTQKTKQYVNSERPHQFMANPQIKTIIANFFRQKEAELAQPQEQTQPKGQIDDEPIKTKDSSGSSDKTKLNTTHINIANIGGKQNINNSRTVENYLRYFFENNRQFTVVYDQYTNGGKDIDVTVILLPSKKSSMDCITITIDKKLDKETCKNLINHLVKQKVSNVDNPNFRKEIVDYLNNL